MIVSKLKPVPFHSVNSPLVLPVRSRLPSGVHLTTLTGCLTLFSDECKCLAGIESTGLIRLAAGGSICQHVSLRMRDEMVKESDCIHCVHSSMMVFLLQILADVDTLVSYSQDSAHMWFLCLSHCLVIKLVFACYGLMRFCPVLGFYLAILDRTTHM